MDLNLYKIFLEVAKTGSISKATESLYVSQPAVSYSVKTLEEQLECKLFNRTAKGVELTANEFYNTIIKIPVWYDDDDKLIGIKYIRAIKKVCNNIKELL